ncbi:MAG: MAPEG family protein [Pseudanabaenaceae cyanobacterium bins.39]|nr:MAPEG family protein [Pseudanabaenaceae cyanobacterium bins.39]
MLNLPIEPSQMLIYGVAIAAGLVYLPYMVVAYGRVSIGIDMSAPRAMFDRLPDFAKRATWAHQNSFEVFALFAAAALTSYVTQTASAQTSLYVLVFLAARFLFSLFYILDWPWLRSPMWVIGMICIGGLFTASLQAV